MRTVISIASLISGLFWPVAWQSSRINVEATAYCGGPCKICGTTGTTATGKRATGKGVAVDPAAIPLKSRLDVPGYGTWVQADDTGGAIKGNRIDLRMDHAAAVQYGRKTIRVRVWRR